MFNKKFGTLIIIIGCSSFFYYLMGIQYYGVDYPAYLSAYEDAYKINGFPWVGNNTKIDAEDLYLWYTAMVKVYSNQVEMTFFLCLNFLICVFISFFMLRSLKLHYKLFFWAMTLPVIFPTLFYHLIRSSLSFFLVSLGIFSLLQPNRLKAIIFAIGFIYLGINFHSQYLLQGVLLVFIFLILKLDKVERFKYNFNLIIISAIILIAILLVLKQFTEQLGEILSFLPSSNIVAGKLGYLTTEDNRGIRITSILSILIYPIMMYTVLNKTYFTETTFIFNNKLKERKFLLLFFALICYGASINIAYFDLTHVAGRLSRLSDYLGMCIIIPIYLKITFNNNFEYIGLFLITIIAPILYAGIYIDVNWNIF